MELKVWVEGIQRIVCGVSDTTTCQDVVYALAHATGKSGRFTLIERWRNNERLLAPNENPLKILMKWGEYSSDVQFILQWNDNKHHLTSSGKTNIFTCPTSPPSTPGITDSHEKHKDIQKSLTFSGNYNTSSDNVGVVKGIPHIKNLSLQVKDRSPHTSPKKNTCTDNSEYPSQRVAPPYKDPPAPPPYRNPPPPTSSSNPDKYKNNILQEISKSAKDIEDNRNQLQKFEERVLYNTQYKELVSLINFQKEKLSSQEADLTKFNAEIVFWESKEREKQLQLDFISREIVTVSNANKINQDQIQALSYVEEENEIVKQQEKTLKSEITLLRSKLANCETELLQCKNKIRLVMDELQIEQRAQIRRNDTKKQYELSLLAEVEKLQKDIDLAKQSTELHHKTADTLKKEVASLEDAIIEKKKQVEYLVTEMKEANLKSLTVAPQDEHLKHVLEGQSKSGSTRKMMCSPRQLENAVPTNKNPHGVWV